MTGGDSKQNEYCAMKNYKIHFCNDIMIRGLFICSEPFYDPSMKDIKWEANFFPRGIIKSLYPDAKNGQTSLELVYNGSSQVNARFLIEIIRNKDEYFGNVEPKIKRETETYALSPERQSVMIENFVTRSVLFDPKNNILLHDYFVFRVKVFFDVVPNASRRRSNVVPKVPPRKSRVV